MVIFTCKSVIVLGILRKKKNLFCLACSKVCSYICGRILKSKIEMEMKKVLFATLLMGSVSAAFSQSNINQGDWMLGGDAGFSSQKQGDYKTTSFGIAPNVGYFFISNLAGGLRLETSSEKTEAGSLEAKSTGYALAPFVRYYFLPASQKVNLFADASFGFGKNKYESGIVDNESKFTQLGIKAGPAIFLTPATALEITLNYNSTKIKDVEDRKNAFGVNLGLQIHIPGTVKK
jgi:hypothetical protein